MKAFVDKFLIIDLFYQREIGAMSLMAGLNQERSL